MGLKRKLLYRIYLASLRYESMLWIDIRRCLFDQMLGRKHRNLQIFPNAFVEDIYGLQLGDDVSINRDSNLSCGGGLTLGDYVAIGHSTTILTSNHGFADPEAPIKYQPVTLSPVKIGSNVWIGARAIILPGVTIANGTIVAAGAVVRDSVEKPNCTVAGVPAKIVKRRGGTEESAMPRSG